MNSGMHCIALGFTLALKQNSLLRRLQVKFLTKRIFDQICIRQLALHAEKKFHNPQISRNMQNMLKIKLL